MPDNPPYHPLDAFIFAEAYIRGGWILKDNLPRTSPPLFDYVITANFALGLELYLKCLLITEGTLPDEVHNLRTLFNQLSKEKQLAIKKDYRRIIREDPYIKREKERLKQTGKNPDKVFRFERVLNEAALAFEKSRYPFDGQYKKQNHEYLAVPIAIATRNLIVKIEPTWDGKLAAIINGIDAQSTSPTH
jgi:hypothetical protein